MSSLLVEAAGGIVWREKHGETQVLLVHRPRYDDWSFPKGKADPGEAPEETALREVEEETGLVCDLAGFAGEVRYVDGKGRPKVVRYWHMDPDRSPHTTHDFVPNDEVDRLRWCSPSDAAKLLTYDHDRKLLRKVAPDPGQAPLTIYLVRHAKAGDRSGFDGPDRMRPLTPNGRRQADALAVTLADVGVTALYSSPYLRCAQTLRPAAERLGTGLELTDALAEGVGAAGALRLIAAHLDDDVALCSHGDVLGDVLHHYASRGVPLHGDRVEKGSIWVLRIEDADVREAVYLPPPHPPQEA